MRHHLLHSSIYSFALNYCQQYQFKCESITKCSLKICRETKGRGGEERGRERGEEKLFIIKFQNEYWSDHACSGYRHLAERLSENESKLPRVTNVTGREKKKTVMGHHNLSQLTGEQNHQISSTDSLGKAGKGSVKLNPWPLPCPSK